MWIDWEFLVSNFPAVRLDVFRIVYLSSAVVGPMIFLVAAVGTCISFWLERPLSSFPCRKLMCTRTRNARSYPGVVLCRYRVVCSSLAAQRNPPYSQSPSVLLATCWHVTTAREFFGCDFFLPLREHFCIFISSRIRVLHGTCETSCEQSILSTLGAQLPSVSVLKCIWLLQGKGTAFTEQETQP